MKYQFIKDHSGEFSAKKMAEGLNISKSRYCVPDRGYFSFDIFENINKTKAFFVARAKVNTRYGIIRKSKSADSFILLDAEIMFMGSKSDDSPGPLRLVRFKNPNDGKVDEFMIDNVNLSASTVAAI